MLQKTILAVLLAMPFFLQKEVDTTTMTAPSQESANFCTASCVTATNATSSAVLKAVIVSGCTQSTTTTLNLPSMTSGIVNQGFTCSNITVKVSMLGAFTSVSPVDASNGTVYQTVPYTPGVKYHILTAPFCARVRVIAN